jgi:hypothetical protein
MLDVSLSGKALSQKYFIEQLSHSHRRFSEVIKGSGGHLETA